MKNLFTLLCFAVAIGCGTMARGQGMSAANPVELSKKINEASILFVENRGQIVGPNGEARPDILFSAKGQGCKVFVTSTGLSYQFLHIENEAETNESQKSDNYRIGLKDHKAGKASTHRMEMKLMGANENATVRSEKQTEYTENFFNVASAPEGIKGVRSFERIVLEEVYPGIDWIVYSNDKGIKYDFIVKPGANPALIKMDYAFADGIKLNRDGSLTISCSLGEVTEDAPVCFQGGKEVKGEFVLKGNVVTVDLEGYDATKELVIDPSVVWSTYYGGNSDDRILDITTDQNGFIYSAGTTSSSNSIASLGYDNTYSGPSDAMLIKMSPSGQLIWATYYGGNGSDEGTCVATFGNTIYLGGSTTSPNQIASPQAHQPQNRGGRDGFIAKFSTSGTRIWSTYYGGPGLDMVTEISVSSSGNVFFCGATNSGNTSHNLIATPNSHQTYFAGGEWDGYVVKMNPSGTRLWGTYYGGPEYEFLEDLRVDSDENVIVVGVAFSLTNATYYPSFPFWPGSGSALAVKFPSAGGHPIWNRYVPNCVSLHAVEIDFQNNIIVGGQVNSFNPLNGCLAKLAPSGNVIWTTTYGGPGHDVISSVDSDPLGNIYIAGRTASSSGISFNGFQNFLTPNNNTSNNQDLMVAKFDMSGTQIWGSYFGGPQNEDHPNIHYAGDGIVYLAGMTRSSSAIAAGTNLLQANPGGGQDGFICKISACEVIAQISPNSPISLCPGASVTLSEVSLNNGNVTYLWSNGNTASSIQVNTPGTYTVTVTEASGCSSQATVTVQQPPVSAIAGSNSPLCAESTLNLSASGGVSYNWSGPNGFTSTAQNPTIANVTTTASGTYSVTATATNGCSSTTTTNVVVNPRPVVSVIFPSNSECAGHQAAIHMQGPGPNHTWLWTGPNNLYLASPSIWIPALSNVHSGTYIGTATNTNGCSDTVTMQLNVITVTASNSGPTCPGGTIQLSAGYNGPLGNTAFSWTGPNGFTSNSQNPVINNFDPSMAGIYTVTRNGCSASTTVSAAPNPISLSISGTATSCNSSVDGSADLNITGGISPLNFFWSNGATTEDLSNLPPGNYSVSVTDNVGCIATATVVISAGPPFTPTASNSGNVCPGGTLTFNASIGTTYSWSGPNGFTSSDQNPIISNFPGVAYGTYAVTVTNAAGCIGTDTATVTPTCPAQALTFDGVDDLVNINNTLGNFGTGDFTVELNVRTTRTGEYIIAKRPSCNFGNFWNVFIIGNGKVAIEVGQGPGNFNYTTFTSVSSVVDGQWHHITLSRNGTLISLYIDGVLENSANPSFVANLNNTAVLRLGYSPCTNVNGTLVYQGDMDEIRIWNRALCLGELQNNQNCTLGGMQTALLAQYSFNQGIAFGNNPTETSLMDNSGNGNNGTLQSFGLNGLISNWVAPGVGNGAPCSAFVAPVIVAGSNSPVCGGTDLNLTVTAGTSYQWSGPNGFTSTLQNPTLNNFSAAMVGTYAVTVTSGSGCASTANVTVAGDAVAPTITCPAAITVNCEPGLCGATVSYAMATGSDNCPNLTLVRALGLASGSFFPRGSNFVTFEAIDGAGNASNCEMGIHVLDNQAPVITCPPSFTVNATLGSCDAMVNFALPTATDNCPSPTVVQVSGNPSGATLGIGTYSYAFEAHDISANQGFCNFTVTVADQEAPTAICQNSNLQLVQGSATLSASNIDNGSSDQCGAVTLSLGQSNFDCSHAGNNNVTLTVTDATGNTSSCVAVVNVIPGAMSVTTQVQTYNCGYGISCNGLSDGRAVATPVGGCPPYSYLWDNGETGATATHLDHYNHNVTVTDGNGTVAGATVYVTEPPLLIFSLSSQTYACGHNLHCYGSHDGFIGSSLSGGCAPYTYSWTGPGGFHSSAPAFANLDAGYYTAVLTDANGCSETADITLTEPTPLEVTICPDQKVTLGWQPEQCALINTTTTGGCAPYSFLWSNNSTDAQQTVCPGITTQYSLNVTDANNCQVQADHWVTVVDVRCGQNLENVKMCNGSNQLMCVNPTNVAQRLLQGWTVGACGENDFESACSEPLNLGCTPTGDIAEICFKYRGVEGGTVSFYRNQGLTQLITTFSNVATGDTVCISANGLPGNTFPNQIYAVVDNGSALQFATGMGNIVIPQDYTELVLVTWTDVNGITCNEDAPVPCPCSGNITSLSLTYVGAPVYMVRIWKDLNHTQLIATFTGVTTNQALIFPLNNVFKIFVEIVGNGVGDTRIETTCNTLEVGQRHGYFDVTAYLDGNGNACPAGHLRMAEASQPESAIEAIHLDAYPNPFQAATTLEFSVPTTQSVSLKLFSLTGVEIASLFEGESEGGVVHKVDFKPVTLASGVYFCILETRSGDRIYHKLLRQD